MAWVRVRSPQTGHEFDLHEKDARIRDGRVEVVEGYPENTGRNPRPAKHRVTKSGSRVKPMQAEQQPAVETKE